MDIYAELTKKTWKEVDEYGFFPLPSGVILNRKKQSRCCYFYCPDKIIAEELTEILDEKGIPWQEN